MSSLFLLLAALLAVLSASTVLAQNFAPDVLPSSAPAPTAAPNPTGGSAPAPTLSGNICIIFFSLPGNVEYPWSVSISLDVQYTTVAGRPYVTLTSGTGLRNYVNKYNLNINRPIILLNTTRYSNNLLYTNGTGFDGLGISYQVVAPIPFPGSGPTIPQNVGSFYRLNSGQLVEDPSFVIDPRSMSITSNIPGFVPVVPIGCPGNNTNCPYYNYTTCRSRLTQFNGGLVLPDAGQISAANVSPYYYSYYLTDNRTWSVVTNLTFTQNTSVGLRTNALLDYYIVITNVTGTRTYNYPLNTPLTVSNVTNATVSRPGVTDQYLYPLQYRINPLPYRYTANTIPWFDVGGVGFGLTPGVFPDGSYRYPAPVYGAMGILNYASEDEVMLMEAPTTISPVFALQQQSLTTTPPS